MKGLPRNTGPAKREQREGMHGHAHEHADAIHRHPHHHVATQPIHEHAHTLAFERYSYLCSPIHDLDPRAKVIAALLAILGIVASPAPRPLEFAGLILLLAATATLARLPLLRMLARSALVLPVAGGIALFAPLAELGGQGAESFASAYAHGLPLVWSILSKAWLSASLVLLVSATTPPSRLFIALRRLGMPAIFITMLTFLYRYASALIEQLAAMRRSIASRAPGLHGWPLVRLYGNLAGSMFIRAYERGERVFAAMTARGFDGTLPTAERLHAGPADVLVVILGLLVAATTALY